MLLPISQNSLSLWPTSCLSLLSTALSVDWWCVVRDPLYTSVRHIISAWLPSSLQALCTFHCCCLANIKAFLCYPTQKSDNVVNDSPLIEEVLEEINQNVCVRTMYNNSHSYSLFTYTHTHTLSKCFMWSESMMNSFHLEVLNLHHFEILLLWKRF